MMDSSCPKGLKDMPELMLEFIESTGISIGMERNGKGDTIVPLSLSTHQCLVRSIKVPAIFEPTPIDMNCRPKTSVILWARGRVFDELWAKIREMKESDAKKVKEEVMQEVGLKKDKLTGQRTSNGLDGWDSFGKRSSAKVWRGFISLF